MWKKFQSNTRSHEGTYLDGRKMAVSVNKEEADLLITNCRKFFTQKYWAITWKVREKLEKRLRNWVRARTSRHRRAGSVNSTNGSLTSTQKTLGVNYKWEIINLVNIRICDCNNFKHFSIMLSCYSRISYFNYKKDLFLSNNSQLLIS